MIFIYILMSKSYTVFGAVVVLVVWQLDLQLTLWVRTPFLARCTRYNIIW